MGDPDARHSRTVGRTAHQRLHVCANLLNNRANAMQRMPVPREIGSQGSGLVHPAIADLATLALADLDPVAVAYPAGPGVAVDQASQRRTLDRLLDRGGPGSVLLAGRHLDGAVGHPLVLVLLNSDSIYVLLEKIARLNRYFHSHHRHEVVELLGQSVELNHVSLGNDAPAPVESLFVCGLYLALFAQVGCRGLRCRFPDAPTGDAWVYDTGSVSGVPSMGTGRWHIEWERFEASRSLPGIEDILLRKLPADLEQQSVASRASRLLQRDLGRSWQVSQVADEFAMSPRTLQRRLGEEGTSFSRLLGETRVRAAAELLQDATKSVSDIGYMLGFADTAHFTRTFKSAMGNTPSQWRAVAEREESGALSARPRVCRGRWED